MNQLNHFETNKLLKFNEQIYTKKVNTKMNPQNNKSIKAKNNVHDKINNFI